MGFSPQKFVSEFYEPSVGDVITIEYERNMGVGASARGETKGRVMKKFTSDDNEFLGFTMSVEKSNHLEGEDDPKLRVKSTNQIRDLDVYLIWPSREHKLNAVPGAIKLVEINKT